MPLKVLLFDLDGTLVDTCADITEALNYAIAPYGSRTFSQMETRGMIGEGLHRLIEKALGRDNPLQEEAVKRFLRYYEKHPVDNSVAYPGVSETLAGLTGLRTAIVSNKRTYLCSVVLESLRLRQYFDLILGSDSLPEKKPSPAPVRHALALMQAKPGEAAIVGDSRYDMDAGKKAGVITIGAAYGYGNREDFREADFIIESFEGLKPVLDRLSSELL
jgi:phosphoglycolate phosphatase